MYISLFLIKMSTSPKFRSGKKLKRSQLTTGLLISIFWCLSWVPPTPALKTSIIMLFKKGKITLSSSKKYTYFAISDLILPNCLDSFQCLLVILLFHMLFLIQLLYESAAKQAQTLPYKEEQISLPEGTRTIPPKQREHWTRVYF